MSFYQYMKEIWKKPRKEKVYKDRLVEWRKEGSTIKIDRPTRLDRARSLGYKAKEGIVVVRQRIIRGGKKKPDFGRRRSKRSGRRLVLSKSYQAMAEERVAKKYSNLEVLNSYFVAEDGRYRWYEIILVDWAHPAIRKDKKLSFMVKHKGRAMRGLTSAGKKSRGLYNKGKGAEKLRPSRRAVVKKRLSTQRK
jgi:large subunit ribosomal protein L15e